MKTDTLAPEPPHKMNAHWRIANHLSLGQFLSAVRNWNWGETPPKMERRKTAGDPETTTRPALAMDTL